MRIILVPDPHLSPRAPDFNANWAVARDRILRQGADAIIHLGDVTADGVVHPEELAFAGRSLADLAMRLVPGNHDVGDPAAGGGEHPLSRARLSAFDDLFGGGSWCFSRDGWRCIGLNAQLLGSGLPEEERQFSWLANLTAQSDERLALFLHKPLFRSGWDDGEGPPRYVPAAARARLRALLPPERLGLVASGHVHQARRLRCGEALHVWAPSTSFCIPDAMQEGIGEKIVGLTLLELGDGDAAVCFPQPPGMIRHNLVEYEAVYPQLGSLAQSLRHARL